MSRFSRKNSNSTPAKQVKLKLVHIDFWSAVRVGFVVSLALGVATVVGFTLFWFILSSSVVNNLLSQVGVGEGGALISLPQMVSYGFIIAFIGVVAITALSGVYAAIFNLIAKITGGLSVGFTNN